LNIAFVDKIQYNRKGEVKTSSLSNQKKKRKHKAMWESQSVTKHQKTLLHSLVVASRSRLQMFPVHIKYRGISEI
jgi:hypothetical protein